MLEFVTPDQMTVRGHGVDLWAQLAFDLSSAGLFFTRVERDRKLAGWYLERTWPRGRDPWDVEDFDDAARRALAAWCWPNPTGAPALLEEVLLRHIEDPLERSRELRRRVGKVAAHLQAAYARYGRDLRQALQPWVNQRDDPYWLTRVLLSEEPLVAEDLLEASAVAGLSFSRGPLWGDPPQRAAPLKISGTWVIDPDVHQRLVGQLQAVMDQVPQVRQVLRDVLRGARPPWQEPDVLHQRHVVPVQPPKPGEKYRPLFDYLDDEGRLPLEEVRLTFEELDELIGRHPDAGRGRRSPGLPDAARHPSWWANPGGRATGEEAVKRRREAATPGRRRAYTAAWVAAGFTAHPETRHVTGPAGPEPRVVAVRFRPFQYRNSWYHERGRLRAQDEAATAEPAPAKGPGGKERVSPE